MNEPVLLHVITKKGKGYEFAERLPEKFHGVSSFNIVTGERVYKCEISKDKLTFTNSFSEAIIEAAGEDDRLVAITAAMAEGTGLDRFAKIFPSRFFDVGMAEQHAVGFAAGLARAGLKPVVAIYSTFLQRSYDQIMHDVCLQNLNVTFMLDRAGIVGEDGPTHHGIFDISYLRHLPNIIIMAPRDEDELKDMFRWAISYNEGPVAIRYPRGSSYRLSPCLKGNIGIELGKAEMLNSGKDLTILGLGYMSLVCVEVGRLLKEIGIECEVINARFIKPPDTELILNSILKTRRLITVEEGVIRGGFGSAILEALSHRIPAGCIIKNIGLPDRFIEHGERHLLLDRYGLSSEKIKQCILMELFGMDYIAYTKTNGRCQR